MRIDADPGIIQEIWERLSFDVPGAKFMAKYKRRLWDGKIHLLNKKNNTLCLGLSHYIESYAKESGYSFASDIDNNSFHESQADSFLKETKWYNNTSEIFPRDYQIEAIKRCITKKRCVTLSPTGCLHPDTKIDVELSYEDYLTLIKLRNKEL